MTRTMCEDPNCGYSSLYAEARVERDALRERLRLLEPFRDWVEMKRPHDEDEADCLTCRAALTGAGACATGG